MIKQLDSFFPIPDYKIRIGKRQINMIFSRIAIKTINLSI